MGGVEFVRSLPRLVALKRIGRQAILRVATEILAILLPIETLTKVF
jgi:hypothetical protein